MTSEARRLLVTGATGGIGRRLRARLEGDTTQSVTFVGGPRHASPSVGPTSGVDLADGDRVYAMLERVRPDAVVHLAAMTGRACDADPDRAWAVNAVATERIADACATLGVGRMVLASTAALYGDDGHSPFAEDAPLNLTSHYAKTKRAAEEALARASAASATLSTVALRIFNVFGESLEDSLVTKLRRSSQEHPVPLAGLDEFVRDYVHVEDVVDAILLSLDASLPTPHAVVNIGSGVPTTNRELVEQLEVIQPVWVTVGPQRTSYSCADISIARAHLGFEPRRTVTD